MLAITLHHYGIFNILFTSQLYPTKPMPVMVWIYGGGFQFGEASRECYSPDYLLREDVVVISINYRLGPLGTNDDTWKKITYI